MVAARPTRLNRKQRKDLTRRLRVEDPGLEVMHPHAAGIDVGHSAHYVAVRPDRIQTPSAGLTVSPPICIGWRIGYSTAG